MSTNLRFNVVVINKAGKVGKSTLSKHLIAPLLGADWIQVETFNDSGQGASAKVAGRKLGFVAEAIATSERSKCIDVGNSNYESAKKEMSQIDGFTDEIDYWVVPCKESAGVMNDSLSTVAELINDLNVDPARIVVIPNEIERPEDGLDSFSSVVAAANRFNFHFCTMAIGENQIFDVFNGDSRSIFQIASADVDYGLLIAKEADPDARAKLAQAKVLQGRARYLARNLAAVWASSPLSSMTKTIEADL